MNNLCSRAARRGLCKRWCGCNTAFACALVPGYRVGRGGLVRRVFWTNKGRCRMKDGSAFLRAARGAGVCVLACVVVVLSFGERSLGQRFGGWGNPYEPTISSRDVETYSDRLELDEVQRETAAMLFEAYQSEFDAAARVSRDEEELIREEIRETRDFSLWGEIRGIRESFAEKSKSMESQYFSDMQALLTAEQSAAWPVIMRDRRRERSMDRGFFSGERVDLVKMVGDLELDEEVSGSLGPVLEQYAIDLDAALTKRNAFQDEAIAKSIDAWQSGDMDTVNELFDNGRKLSMDIKEINERYASQVRSQLPQGVREEFETSFQRASFPQVYREMHAERVLESAEGFEDLTTDQAEGLRAIRATFTSTLESLRKKMESAVEQRELSMTPQEMFRGRGRRGGGEDGEPSEVRQLRSEIRDLGRETEEKVRNLLDEEQAARLPERRGRGDGGERRRRGRGRE